MYKALKENKIIAISDTDSQFPCLVYHSIEEDTEHTCEDYEQYNGEYLLKEDVPAPTKEEISALREQAYVKEVDTLHAEKQRKMVLGTWTEEDEAEYVAQVKVRSEDIANRYPYPEIEVTNDVQ